ncbi:2-hydroxy-6-oxononadienedioate/2-hydroxy-6-oxononatrienedioate hydrolase [bacterium HR12]|nr:2-hydroxy-6-oxononadienedioate/2-hydroxy-6-oxononatrienedioate hydrolase [bacterium HR12]
MTGSLLRLPDGRDLEVRVVGPEEGTLLVFHHGSPGAAVPFPRLEEAASARGVRVASFSRPGFGASSRRPGRRVADVAEDVAALADHLGAERFLTLGASGGGPHAVATAALLPTRVLAAATIGGVAPYDAEGLDWTEGMGEDNRTEYPLAARDPEALLAWMEPQVETFRRISAEEVISALRSLVSPVDEAALAGELGAFLAASGHAAFRLGPWGWYDDDLAFVAPWGFDLAAIRCPVAVWQGGEDRFVPFAHGRWLAEHLPTARPRLRPEHGHLSLLTQALDAILDDLLELAAA